MSLLREAQQAASFFDALRTIIRKAPGVLRVEVSAECTAVMLDSASEPCILSGVARKCFERAFDAHLEKVLLSACDRAQAIADEELRKGKP
jgi:hypothetical protein